MVGMALLLGGWASGLSARAGEPVATAADLERLRIGEAGPSWGVLASPNLPMVAPFPSPGLLT